MQGKTLPAWAQEALLPAESLFLAKVMLPGDDDVLVMAAMRGYDIATTGTPHANLAYDVIVTAFRVRCQHNCSQACCLHACLSTLMLSDVRLLTFERLCMSYATT